MIELDRRQMLEGLGALLGLTALPASALAAAAKRPPLLDAPTSALLVAVCDTLIPRTDTPGALQAKVPATVDALLRDWASPAHRAAHLTALGAIDAAARAKAGKPFALLTPAARLSFLSHYDAENFASNPDYFKLKDLLITAYYMSEPGATQELRYEHVPGAWEPSIPLAKDTRAWAGHNVG
jgi:gluconate 2-dehydrogenase gamma chain